MYVNCMSLHDVTTVAWVKDGESIHQTPVTESLGHGHVRAKQLPQCSVPRYHAPYERKTSI